jgi:hypothetical protein
MAAANESQGLKIAVAAFITLSVILGVTSYFLYSNGASAEARLQLAEDNLTKKATAADLALKQFEDFRGKIGTKGTEYEAAKEEITASHKKIEERLNELINQVDAALKRAQAAGAQGPELEEAKANIQRLIASYRAEPKSFISSLDRLTELMESESLLLTELALSYKNIRTNLESATGVAKEQIDVQTKAAATSHADVIAEQTKHTDERGRLLKTVDKLQSDNDKATGEINNLNKRLADQEADNNRKQETMTTLLRELRDRLERQELILDRPDGYVTYVDYETREVLVSLNRKMGARPQMNMTIFDAHSPGIPTEKPKGNIMLTQVGEQFSSAKILKMNNPIDPIRVGDIVYSAAWSPNQPMRFALVGKIDINRDSRDDRAELKRMIQEAGGIVEFDLPPPDLGKETGTLSPRIDWYVIDDEPPIRDAFVKESDNSTAQASRLEKRVGEVIKEARLNGIRPMTKQRLLIFLGYDLNAPIMGRAEAIDPKSMMRLTSPRRHIDQPKPAAGDTMKGETKADDAKPEEMKKEDAGDDEPKPKAKTSKKAAAKKKAAEDEGDEPKS